MDYSSLTLFYYHNLVSPMFCIKYLQFLSCGNLHDKRNDTNENRHIHVVLSTLDHVTRNDNIQGLEGVDSYLQQVLSRFVLLQPPETLYLILMTTSDFPLVSYAFGLTFILFFSQGPTCRKEFWFCHLQFSLTGPDFLTTSG